MDWENEPWVKVYTRETDDDIALSWEARALWDALMKRFDQSGVIACKRGARALASASRMPIEVVERVLPELLVDGRLREVEGAYIAPNFVDAQRARKSDAQRKRESRESRRAKALGQTVTFRDQPSIPELGQTVTNSDVPVTKRDDPSALRPSVTKRDIRSLREEREETDERESPRARAISPSPEYYTAPAPTHVAAPPELPRPGIPDPEDPALRARKELGDGVWKRLELLRAKFAHDHGVKLRPLPIADQGRRELAIRIRETGDLSRAEADCDHVLAIAEAEAWTIKSAQWLTGSIFEEKSWQRKLGMSKADARAAPRRGAADATAPLRIVRSSISDEDDMPPLPAGMRK